MNRFGVGGSHPGAGGYDAAFLMIDFVFNRKVIPGGSKLGAGKVLGGEGFD